MFAGLTDYVCRPLHIGGGYWSSVGLNASIGAGGNAIGQILGGFIYTDTKSGYNFITQVGVQGVIGGLSGGVGNVVQAGQALNYLRAGLTYAEGLALGSNGGTSAAIATSVAINSLLPTSLGGYTTYGNSSAKGGFLLYPNKSNTNQMQSVYSK
jgi:hypothetical protein